MRQAADDAVNQLNERVKYFSEVIETQKTELYSWQQKFNDERLRAQQRQDGLSKMQQMASDAQQLAEARLVLSYYLPHDLLTEFDKVKQHSSIETNERVLQVSFSH